jgi:HEAT repeat protein
MRCLLSGMILGLLFPALAAAGSGDEELLKSAGLASDGSSLLRFFRQRTQPQASRDEIQSLIEQLGKGPPEAREKAAGDLVALGMAAIPGLRQALKDPDAAEIQQRAQRCLEEAVNPALPAAAARLLGQLKPDGAAAALLAYLPFADDDNVAEEVEAALATVALRNGQAEPALVAALEDPVPVRRSAAAGALCQAGGTTMISQVRKLLRDPKPTVRLHVALALGRQNDEEAIPELIALLDDLPPDRGKLAEDFLLNLAGDQAPNVPLGKDEASRQRCREAWAAWWQAVDAASLLEFFRKRTLSDPERERVQALIRQLGDDAFSVREQASSELVALGGSAVPLLRQALKSADVEVMHRAEDCLKLLEKTKDAMNAATAARILALRKPAGAAETLLNFMPFSEDETMRQALQEALGAVAVRDGKIEPVLLRALEDRSAAKRAAAAEAVCGSGPAGPSAVRKLLHDRDRGVRWQAARALAASGDREAIPVLIALLTELPAEQTGPVTDLLLQLAGEHGPRVEPGGDQAARQNYRAAWSTWWRTHGATADLGRLHQAPRLLGYTLLVQIDANNNLTGRLTEVSANGKVRWEITNLRSPMDAQVLPNEHVLVAENRGMQVTERDRKGQVLWRKQIAWPINCQRLPTGNTFIACRHQLVEVDRSGKEVFAIQRPGQDVLCAYKLRDGQIVCLTSNGQCLRMDTSGKVVKSFVAGPSIYGSGLDVLPNGHVLVAQFANNRVVEFDADGQTVWDAAITNPTGVNRLPNGHTLVACQNMQRVFELDRKGKTVWEYSSDARPSRARRR